MKQSVPTLLAFLLLASNANGQHKTYVGFEFSVADDLYKIKDNGSYLKSIPLYNVQGGINVRQELNRHYFVEAAVILKTYQEGFGFKTIRYNGSSSGDKSWLVPLRFGMNVNLYQNRLFLVPIVGYTIGFNPPTGNGSGYATQKSNTTIINYYFTESANPSRVFSLIQTGVGLEFKAPDVLLFTISANYYTGLNKTSQLDINYTVNNGPLTSGTATSKGGFWCISTGLKYPISNIWKKA